MLMLGIDIAADRSAAGRIMLGNDRRKSFYLFSPRLDVGQSQTSRAQGRLHEELQEPYLGPTSDGKRSQQTFRSGKRRGTRLKGWGRAEPEPLPCPLYAECALRLRAHQALSGSEPSVARKDPYTLQNTVTLRRPWQGYCPS